MVARAYRPDRFHAQNTPTLSTFAAAQPRRSISPPTERLDVDNPWRLAAESDLHSFP
jgi:hypothetical protein